VRILWVPKKTVVGSMTRKKGGGRESGVKDEGAGVTWTTTAAPNVGADYPYAAADPAAYLRCHCEQLIPNDPQGRRLLEEHHRHMDKTTGAAQRIRELEAELSLLRKASGKTPWGDLQFQIEGQRARAERAEARVKDLEGWLGSISQDARMKGWAIRLAELRGEDRG